jgi:hypothetical protein
MDENESNKRENSMLGPQGTGHAQIFAKGDSPLAVSGAARSRLQPEGHTNISRSEADLEIRVSDFESTASGGSGALFPTSGEQELLSGEKLQDPLQTVKTPVLGGSQSEGRHSSPRHFLATLLSVSDRRDQGASEKVTLSADGDEKVDQQDQKHALQTAAESLQAPVNRCIRRPIDVVSDETGWGTQANMRDTTPIHQFDFGSSTAQENVRESEGVDLAEKHGFSVHEKTTAVDDLNSVKSLHFDKIPRTNCPDLLSNAFGSLQQRGNVPESESILHVSNQKRFLQNLHVSDNAACELKNSAQTVFDSGPSTTSRPTSG